MGLEEGQPLRRGPAQRSDHARTTKAAAGRSAAGPRPHCPSRTSAAGFQQAPARGGAGRGRTRGGALGEHVAARGAAGQGAEPQASTSTARGGAAPRRDARAPRRCGRAGGSGRRAGRREGAAPAAPGRPAPRAQGRRGPMLLPLACLHGRVAQCLTALLVLAEPPPRPRRGARAHGAPPPRAEAALPAKMAAELYAPAGAAAAAATATDIANSNAAAAAAGRKGRPSAPLPALPPPAPAPPALDNNNLESPNWQSFHPTLRER